MHSRLSWQTTTGCVLVYRYTKEGNINELRHNSMYGYENKRNSLVYRYTRTAPHNLTSLSSLLDDCTCSYFMKLSHSCCATSTWLNEIYIASYFTSSEPGWKEETQGFYSWNVNLTPSASWFHEGTLHSTTTQACQSRDKPEVLNVLKICFIVIDHSLP